MLFNQFHDTLGGTSIAPAYEDSRDQYGHASLAANAFNRAVQTISRRIDIPSEPELRPIVVFNPHPRPLRGDVEFEYTWLPADGARMTDETGTPVPVQAIRPQTTMQLARAARVPRRPAAARIPRPGSIPGPRSAPRRRRPTPGSRTSTWQSRSTPRPGGSRGSSTSGPAPTSSAGARTPSSSTTTWTPGGTACSGTTTSPARSSAHLCDSSSTGRCGRRSGSRAGSATRR